MYKQLWNSIENIVSTTMVIRLADIAYIPTNPANTDYQHFKKEVLTGAELQDADGNTMTAEEAKQFIATLP
jgi:hypothetical protein